MAFANLGPTAFPALFLVLPLPHLPATVPRSVSTLYVLLTATLQAVPGTHVVFAHAILCLKYSPYLCTQ